MNYRSAVAFGIAREVNDRDEQLMVARALADHVAPGRAADARPPTEDELRQTLMLAIELDESSAKIRTGPPKDEDEDLDLPVWAGILPLRLATGTPDPAPDLRGSPPVPGYVERYRRPGAPE